MNTPARFFSAICGDRNPDPLEDMAEFDGQHMLVAEQPRVKEVERESIVDEIEEIIFETHEIDVTDRNYAENIVGWLERRHPAALRSLAEDE